MAEYIVLPKMGVNMVEAIIVEWSVAIGGKVQEGDVIAVAETDKAAQDIYAPKAGVILAHVVELGKVVKCQEPIAILGTAGENIEDLHKKKAPVPTTNAAQTILPQITNSAQTTLSPAGLKIEESPIESGTTTARIRISPLAKKMAGDHGISLTSMVPAQKGERITKKDVLRFLEGKGSPTAIPDIHSAVAEKRIPLSLVRKTIASRLSLSNQTKPKAVLDVRVDATELLKWKEAAKTKGLKIGVSEVIIKALGKVLSEYPLLRARMENDELIISEAVNIGVAVDTSKGLMVPVIRNADRKGMAEISAELRTQAAKARSGSLSMDEISGGIFSVTNLGMLGIERFTPVINPPECGILAVGAIRKELVVDPKDDSISIKPLFWISLAFDHRVIDGAPAGEFLMALKSLLEWPLSLVH